MEIIIEISNPQQGEWLLEILRGIQGATVRINKGVVASPSTLTEAAIQRQALRGSWQPAMSIDDVDRLLQAQKDEWL